MDDACHIRCGIIGAGVMGEALLVAISQAGIAVASVAIADKRSDRVAELQKKYGCFISSPSATSAFGCKYGCNTEV